VPRFVKHAEMNARNMTMTTARNVQMRASNVQRLVKKSPKVQHLERSGMSELIPDIPLLLFSVKIVPSILTKIYITVYLHYYLRVPLILAILIRNILV